MIEDNLENTTDSLDNENVISEIEADKENNEIDNTVNCLALTVKENYHIIKVKNIFKKSANISWKVALSVAVINFLNLFL